MEAATTELVEMPSVGAKLEVVATMGWAVATEMVEETMAVMS